MTFTRRSDSATMTPDVVELPFNQSRAGNAIIRQLAQSADVRVTYTGANTSPRKGFITLKFSSYAAANAASEFFASSSLFEFDGENEPRGDYVIIDDRILESETAGAGDMAIVFGVTDECDIIADDPWTQLRVPYMEVPE